MGPRFDEILTDEALAFVADLHRRFNPRRQELLAARKERQSRIDAGEMPDFLPETDRRSERRLAGGAAPRRPRRPPGRDHRSRRSQDDDQRPQLGGQGLHGRLRGLQLPDLGQHDRGPDQPRRTPSAARIDFTNPDGKDYRLNDETATLMVRPRGWHLDRAPHARRRRADLRHRCSTSASTSSTTPASCSPAAPGPYFYLPKLESHLEARLWNDVFVHAQEALGIPHGTIRATVLIETILAAFEMDEILYELRDHSAGLNAGRWDYIFSIIKKFRNRPDMLLPDRAQISDDGAVHDEPYTDLLIKTCHRRGAHAMGGMAAFIPSRRDEEINRHRHGQGARGQGARESSDGHDGTWVAHPDLVPLATEVFDAVLGDRAQPDRQAARRRRRQGRATCSTSTVAGGQITDAGVRTNVDVAIQYLASWLRGNGAAAIYNLMEDAATAEISRRRSGSGCSNGATLPDGTPVTAGLVRTIADRGAGPDARGVRRGDLRRGPVRRSREPLRGSRPRRRLPRVPHPARPTNTSTECRHRLRAKPSTTAMTTDPSPVTTSGDGHDDTRHAIKERSSTPIARTGRSNPRWKTA